MTYEYARRPGGLGGFGYFGPDQPWTEATAKTWITEATRPCQRGWKTSVYPSLTINPRMIPKFAQIVKDHKVIVNPDCYPTGRIKEAKAAGRPRGAEWCCPPPDPKLPRREVTPDEITTYQGFCHDIERPGSEPLKATELTWVPKDQHIGGRCHETGVAEGEYTLTCCAKQALDIQPGTTITDLVTIPDVAPLSVAEDARQAAEAVAHEEAQMQAELERRQAVVESMGPGPAFLQRYWIPLVLVAGAIAAGGAAVLIKRRKMQRNAIEFEPWSGSGSIFDDMEENAECNCCL